MSIIDYIWISALRLQAGPVPCKIDFQRLMQRSTTTARVTGNSFSVVGNSWNIIVGMIHSKCPDTLVYVFVRIYVFLGRNISLQQLLSQAKTPEDKEPQWNPTRFFSCIFWYQFVSWCIVWSSSDFFTCQMGSVKSDESVRDLGSKEWANSMQWHSALEKLQVFRGGPIIVGGSLQKNLHWLHCFSTIPGWTVGGTTYKFSEHFSTEQIANCWIELLHHFHNIFQCFILHHFVIIL